MFVIKDQNLFTSLSTLPTFRTFSVSRKLDAILILIRITNRSCRVERKITSFMNPINTSTCITFSDRKATVSWYAVGMVWFVSIWAVV